MSPEESRSENPPASSWLVSTFTLQTLRSLASASMVGFMARHGGHHEAQKSTSTGSLDWRTLSSS